MTCFAKDASLYRNPAHGAFVLPVANKFVSSIAVAAFLVANSVCSAEVFVGPDGSFVALIGEIDSGAAALLTNLFVSRPTIKIVILDSIGGSVDSALDIALMVRRLGLSTYVPEDAYCASACSFIFFAGIERLVEGRLGVHQFYGAQGDAASVESSAQYVVSSILDAFEIFGVDWRVTKAMLTTSSEAMFVFDDRQLVEWGINSAGMPSDPLGSLPSAETAKFSDYNVEAISLSENQVVLPDFEGRDNWARNFRTRIRSGMSGGTNFAGQFSLIEIGCGTSCRFAYVGDLISGEVFSFPYGGEEQYEMSLLFVPESRLIKVRWATYDLESCINQDLEFRDGEFVVLSEYKTPRSNYCNEPE